MTTRPQQEEEPDEVEEVQTQGLLKSRKAVLPSEVCRRERSTEDPKALGCPEEQLGSRSQSGEIEERHRPEFKPSVSHLVSRGRETIQKAPSKPPESWETHSSILKHQTLDIDRDLDDLSNTDSIQQDPRVSVAQLRHSYMESASTPTSRRQALL